MLKEKRKRRSDADVWTDSATDVPLSVTFDVDAIVAEGVRSPLGARR